MHSALPGSAAACGVMLLAIAGCAPESVSLDLPPPPPLKGSQGACSAAPSALAHLSGIVADVMAADLLNLYVVASAGADGSATQGLWRVPKDGSTPQRLATSETPIEAIAVDSFSYPQTSAVYRTTAGAPGVDGGATGAVLSIGLAPTDEPVVIASDRRSPGALLRLDATLFWAEQDIEPSGQIIETIVETTTPGGPVTRVQTLDADQVPHRFAAYEFSAPDASLNSLFWTTWNSRVGTESMAQIIECPVPAPFGPQTRITGPDAGGVAAMSLDSRFTGVLYSGPQGIVEVDVTLDGGRDSPRPIANTGGFVDRIEDDDTDVYFVERSTGRLIGAPRFHFDAQAPRTIASSVDPATAFRVDDACVYWIDPRAETITMAAK